MRALFTSNPTLGHFLPLTPIARAMLDMGHDVAFATPQVLRSAVEEFGFRWIRAGVDDDDAEMVPIWSQWRKLHGAELGQFAQTEIFGGIRARRLVPDLLNLAETWQPDLFIRESREFGGLLAAELLDVPQAYVEVHAAGARPHVTAGLYEPLQRLRATLGLQKRPIQELMDQYLVLSSFPASMNTLGDPIARTTHRVRALPADTTRAVLPSWVDAVGSRRLVYVSLGTVFSGHSGELLFPKLLHGLHDVDAEVVVTVGNDLDPASLGPQPDHIHLERYLPLGELLPHCSAVLFHGGSGTLGHVIANGLPMVMLPLAADQPENAARCAELGASRTLNRDSLTAESISEAVLDVLHTPGYRHSAERLQGEFERLPGPEFAVQLLEQLASEHMPIICPR